MRLWKWMGSTIALGMTVALAYHLWTRNFEAEIKRQAQQELHHGMPSADVMVFLKKHRFAHSGIRVLPYGDEEYPAGTRVVYGLIADWRNGFNCLEGIQLKARLDADDRLAEYRLRCLPALLF